MRLKLDENQPRALLALFRDAGHEVDAAADEGLQGKSDAELLARCQTDQRALLTFDLDFADLRPSRAVSGPPGITTSIASSAPRSKGCPAYLAAPQC